MGMSLGMHVYISMIILFILATKFNIKTRKNYQGLDHFLGTIHGSLTVLYEHHKDLEEESPGLQHAAKQLTYINRRPIVLFQKNQEKTYFFHQREEVIIT